MINPWTALYVGYNDSYANLMLDAADVTGLRRIGSPTTNVGRQFFVKLSYLFRY